MPNFLSAVRFNPKELIKQIYPRAKTANVMQM